MRRRHLPGTGLLCTLAVGLLPAAAAHGQDGRTDLRYTAAAPLSVTYTTVDSMHSTVTGLPTGDMPTTVSMRSVTHFSFEPAADGVSITSTVREASGSVSTPMGDMPMPRAGAEAPMTFVVGPTGPSVEEMMKAAALDANPTAGVPGPQPWSVIIALPGRELRIGETWSDTTDTTLTHEGIEAKFRVITTGTYAADTTVAGRPLNVLRISSRMAMEMAGQAAGVNFSQTGTTTSSETVLWDPARHIPVVRDATSDIDTTSVFGNGEMTMGITGRIRSIARAEDLD